MRPTQHRVQTKSPPPNLSSIDSSTNQGRMKGGKEGKGDQPAEPVALCRTDFKYIKPATNDLSEIIQLSK